MHVRREEDNVQCILDDKLCKLYIAVDVPEDTYFMPQTRKEISKVGFIRLLIYLFVHPSVLVYALTDIRLFQYNLTFFCT